MQTATAADLASIRTGVHHIQSARFELRNRAGTLLLVMDTTDPNWGVSGTPTVANCTVQVDTRRETLRTCDLEIYDPSGSWFAGPGASVWIGARLTIYKGFVGTAMWPQGVFNLSQPENLGEYRIRLRGADKSTDANGKSGGGYLDVQIYPAGTRIDTAIGQVAAYTTWNETLLRISPNATQLPFAKTFRKPETPWSAVDKLCMVPDAGGVVSRRYFDESGYLTTESDPDPTTQPVVETFQPSPTAISLYVNADKRVEDATFANCVVVVGGSTRTGIFKSTKMVTTGPASVSNIGYRIYWHNNGSPDPMLNSQADCDNLAAYLLGVRQRWNELVNLTIGEHPLLQPWDCVQIIDPAAGLNDKFQAIAYTMPVLSGGGQMQVQGWRVVAPS